jgi:hypothetical protein
MTTPFVTGKLLRDIDLRKVMTTMTTLASYYQAIGVRVSPYFKVRNLLNYAFFRKERHRVIAIPKPFSVNNLSHDDGVVIGSSSSSSRLGDRSEQNWIGLGGLTSVPYPSPTVRTSVCDQFNDR